MIDVLDQPEHRVTNFLFVGLNILAILNILGGFTETVAYLVQTDGQTGGLFVRMTITVGIFGGFLLASLSMAALAQILRYLASAASK